MLVCAVQAVTAVVRDLDCFTSDFHEGGGGCTES